MLASEEFNDEEEADELELAQRRAKEEADALEIARRQHAKAVHETHLQKEVDALKSARDHAMAAAITRSQGYDEITSARRHGVTPGLADFAKQMDMNEKKSC